MRKTFVGMVLFACVGCVAPQEEVSSLEQGVAIERAANPSGFAESISRTGNIDRSNAFFQQRGTTGRTCETCHHATAGWTITPTLALAQFNKTAGLAPLFRRHDASTNPAADHSTVQQRANRYALVVRRGLIQTPNTVPIYAEYVLDQIADPYGSSTTTQFLRFRRPNPISNEGLTQTVSWNGINAPPRDLLEGIANAAARFHLQAPTDLSAADREAMADFMEGLIHAQAEDLLAGPLDDGGARGGVAALAAETFVVGENDPASAGFNPEVFTLFGAWANLGGNERNLARAAIARGEIVFNTKRIFIEGVAGLNDALFSPRVAGTCSTCHNTPNIGHHSVFRPMNIGTASPSAPGASELPRLTVRNKVSGQVVQLTDLGVAGDSFSWRALGKFSVPRLRGLAARAPYFHAGSAASLANVVDFYQFRFGIEFNGSERSDLIAFLSAL